MMVNGLNPLVFNQELQDINTQGRDPAAEKPDIEAKEVKKEPEHDNPEKAVEKLKQEKDEDSKGSESDYQLKELLFLMTARGNSTTVEKLAELLKKERDMLQGH